MKATTLFLLVVALTLPALAQSPPVRLVPPSSLSPRHSRKLRPRARRQRPQHRRRLTIRSS